jgi:hypothetical protein
MFLHTFASWIWLHLRPFVKLFFRIIIHFESRVHRQPGRLESGISYVYERLEIALLFVGVLFGAMLAFITGSFAGIILVPYSIAKTWPIITTLAPKLGAHFWQSLKNLPLSFFMGVVEFVWPTPEPYTVATPATTDATPHQTAGGRRHSERTFFLSDATMDSRSSDEMEVLENASGSWKVSDTVENPQLRLDLTSDLRISTSPTRRHRRIRAGSSISLSGTSSPELIKTPLIVNSEGRDGFHRRHRSGSSSPESYFRMTALHNTDRAQSASDLRRHRRSGSSSAVSIRSQGMNRASDRG